MKQPDALNLVAEFHKTFKHPILDKPAIPGEDRCKLRVALIAEELKELEVAILEKDIVSVADALCDIQYVLSGAILEFGLADKFSALFEEVQRSNMSKACRTEDEAKATVEHYLKKDGIMLQSSLERVIGRISAEHHALNDKLTLGLNIMSSNSKASNVPLQNMVFQQAVKFNPMSPVYNANGTFF